MFFSYEFVGENSWNGYEHNCFFTNVGDGQFIDVARANGGDGIRDGRGVAIADFDGDGRLDLAINNNNNGPTIYRNRHQQVGNWLTLSLAGDQSNSDAVGAKVSLTAASDSGQTKTLTRWVEAGSGYASQSAFPLHFGLGGMNRVESLEITWPSGHVDQLSGADLNINSRTRIEEGGRVASLSKAEPTDPETHALGVNRTGP